MIRRTVHYSGSVQGVGFRYTAHRLAQDTPISGHVCNLPDGRVELVAEGEPAAVDRFLGQVREAMGALIRGEDVSESTATGEFGGFEIVY